MLKISEELLTEVYNTAQEAVTKTLPRIRNATRLSEEVSEGKPLQELKKKRSERQKDKRKYMSI